MLLSIGLSGFTTAKYDSTDDVGRAAILLEWTDAARKELDKDPEVTAVEFRHARTGQQLVLIRRRTNP